MIDLHDEAASHEVVSSERPFHGRVWDVANDVVRFEDGDHARHYIAHPGAAAVVALDDAGRVILIQQYRHPIRERDWEIPAGLLDVPGEDPLVAAKRELAEEVDKQASRWDHLITFTPTPGSSSEVIHVYLARDISDVKTDFVREGEEADMRVEWVALNDAVDAVMAGRLRNGTLSVSLLAAAEFLRRSA